jgi:hypothetical protein
MEETYEQLEYRFHYGFSSSQPMNNKAKPKSAWVKHPQAPCEEKELKGCNRTGETSQNRQQGAVGD